MDILNYYLNYIKTHLYYLISKKNLIVFTIFNIFFIGYTFYLSNISKSKIELDAYRDSYYQSFNTNFFLFFKIIYISLILFLNISYFNKEYKEYSQYFIRNKRTKIDFYITKYFSFILVMFLELVLFLTVYIIFNILLPYGKIEGIYLVPFINIFLLGIFYFLLSSLLMLLFKTYLSSIFSLLFFWISFALSEYNQDLNSFIRVLLLIVPFPSGTYSVFSYGSIHIVLYITILTFINILVLIKTDGV